MNETSDKVTAVCPICHQELTLITFKADFAPPRRFGVTVSRIPYHPLQLTAVCDARLAIHCPISNQVVYERCDGEHAAPECIDPTCWAKGSSQ